MKKLAVWFLSRLPFYFLFYVLPVLVMGSCEGWNAGNMETQSCAIDLWVVRKYADIYYAFVMFSSFMLALPILAYLIIFFFVSEFFGRSLKETVFSEKNAI